MFGAAAAGSVVPDKPTRSIHGGRHDHHDHHRHPDLAAARARNEATWRAAAVALYAGDIEEFLAHWTAEPRYSVAYPVDGIPPTVEGRDQFRALFGGFGAAADPASRSTTCASTRPTTPTSRSSRSAWSPTSSAAGSYENLLAIRVTFRDGLIADMYEYYGQVAHQAMVATASAAPSERRTTGTTPGVLFGPGLTDVRMMAVAHTSFRRELRLAVPAVRRVPGGGPYAAPTWSPTTSTSGPASSSTTTRSRTSCSGTGSSSGCRTSSRRSSS